ncbi:unnamed protein product [Lathyrus oleraceus]|uniref:J domain-containing protein n=2 Tax=Pisum sativum TaxID=3888 RepID=A0A9D4XTI8_PEA|nr:uncharacterized protein LOC127126365 [Pisum sativum]KAI5427151.1 hypothetical protein KIW84_032536 [Pisum sativum]KAI5427152.1 hypothetical protein KIW84_032536 [Pisum sativum]
MSPAPINSSSDTTPRTPIHFAPFNADAIKPPSSTARARSRPRLAKLRKQSASQTTRSRSRTASAVTGFNPFRSDQVCSASGTCDSGFNSMNGSEGFVFGARKVDSDSVRDLDSEVKETEFRKSGSVEFVFCAEEVYAKLDSLFEGEGKSSENEGKTVSGEERETLNSEGEKGEVNVTGFVFSAGRNDNPSSLNKEKGKPSVPVGNSGYEYDDGGERECKEFVFGKKDSSGDKNGGIKMSSFNVEKQDSVDSMRNSDNGSCTFHAETETFSNFGNDADKGGNLGNDIKSKSGNGSTNGFSSTYSGIHVSQVVDEMKKLNINHPEGVHIPSDSTNSHVHSSNGFVFGGSDNVSSRISVSSGSNTGGQQLYTNDDFENIGGQYTEDCRTNDVQNGTAHGIARDAAATGIPCSKTSTSQDGINDFQCGKIPEFQVSEDAQVNGTEQSYTDFKPPTWDPSSFKENLFCKLNEKFESTQNSKSSKEKGSKCMRQKLKSCSLNKKQTKLDHLPKESCSLETPEPSGSFSPMDFSPYQEASADDQDVKASEELNVLHSTIPTDLKDECLAAIGREYINSDGQRCRDLGNDQSCYGSSSVDVHSSAPEIIWPKMQTQVFSSSSTASVSADAGVDFTSNSEKKKADIFCFDNGLGDSKEKDFSFSAGSTIEITSLFKPKQKKKFRRKTGRDSFVISPNVNGKSVSSVQFSPLTTANMSSHSDMTDKSHLNNQFEEEGGTLLDTIQAACYQWRLRGNRAHKAKDLSKAEECYTQGIVSVPSNKRSGCCIKPLLLCYSNRAATRMTLGRIREALEDCMIASSLDPTFLKVQIRAANCHLLLGEVENAQRCYNKCLESSKVVCLDRRVTVEAAEGIQKAQEVAKCMNDAAKLLKERTSDAGGSALELLTKALSKSLYSERLLQMKADALYLLQKYDAAIQLCDQSLNLAEKNFVLANSVNNSMHNSYSSVKMWRWSFISKCYFRLGKLDASLNVIEKLQQTASANDKCGIDNIEELLSLAATIQELLDHRKAGNENFKMGKYTEAVENYTAALSSNIKSRPFAAICFGNRAAAHQASGQIADAIADCSMAMALDGNYAKAISRRATLHEMVRDYEQAACDIRRLISVLGSQSNEKAKHSESPNGSTGGKESRQAQQRLLAVEDQAKMRTPLDFYLILGIKPADTAADIKKAYHKAALRHHPDKAGQLLARSEVGDEGLFWKEISQEVHKDADRLFKMIGEAYAVLSDPAKREEYDMEEDIRKLYKQSNRAGACRRSSDVYGNGRSSDGYRSSYDRTYNRRYGHWSTYGDSYSRW